LFACAIAVDPQVVIYSLPVRVVTASASDPAGGLLAVAGVDGLVSVPVPPTATPFDTATPTATWTPDADPHPTTTGDPGGIRSRKPTSSRLPTAAPPGVTAPTPTAAAMAGSSGCAIAPSERGSLPLALICLALAVARRVHHREHRGHRGALWPLW
jgi:hypothetical protein